MDVIDIDGDKVGTIGKIFQPTAVRSSAGTVAEPAGEMILKVDTGFLGLGKNLYIPVSAVSDVRSDKVMLGIDKDAIDGMGWDNRPAWIDD
jgi:hypothetical protein